MEHTSPEHKRIQELEKQNRLLQKKLERSESNRLVLENA